RCSAFRLTCRHQVARHLRLAVHHDRVAGEAVEIDPERPTVAVVLKSVVDEALTLHAAGAHGFLQQLDRAALQHAGTNAPEHVCRAAPFEDDAFDALP